MSVVECMSQEECFVLLMATQQWHGIASIVKLYWILWRLCGIGSCVGLPTETCHLLAGILYGYSVQPAHLLHEPGLECTLLHAICNGHSLECFDM